MDGAFLGGNYFAIPLLSYLFNGHIENTIWGCWDNYICFDEGCGCDVNNDGMID